MTSGFEMKCGEPKRSGRRRRAEIRIPFSLAMRVYEERTK